MERRGEHRRDDEYIDRAAGDVPLHRLAQGSAIAVRVRDHEQPGRVVGTRMDTDGVRPRQRVETRCGTADQQADCSRATKPNPAERRRSHHEQRHREQRKHVDDHRPNKEQQQHP